MASAAFTPLGHFPYEKPSSEAYDVSSDGQLVVGQSLTTVPKGKSPSRAFMYSSGRMEALGIPPRGMDTIARAVSADGATVVGAGSNRAFRWTQSTGIRHLPKLAPEERGSYAAGVSADGNTVVGKSELSDEISHAFIWTEAEGMRSLGFLRGEGKTGANAVSADGSAVAGGSNVSRANIRAFRWSETDGMVALGPTDTRSAALDISDDGRFVVGTSFVGGLAMATLWLPAGETVHLGRLEGARSSEGTGVSADETMVVGQCIIQGGNEAFFWTKANGIRRLYEVLSNDYDLGPALAGWRLVHARKISANGRFITGFGMNPNGNPEAFLVRFG